MTHGCALLVQTCMVGLSHDVSSNVPPSTARTIPLQRQSGLSSPNSRVPHSGHAEKSFATPALGYAVGDQPRLRTRQVECLRGYYDADGERAARETLAVRAVARVHAERLPRDLIADRSAHASAFQWQFHAPLPRRHPSPNPLQRPIAPSCGCRLLRPHQKTHFHRVTRRRSAATLRSYPSESPKLLHCALPAVCWLRLDEACTGAAVIRMLDLFSRSGREGCFGRRPGIRRVSCGLASPRLLRVWPIGHRME